MRERVNETKSINFCVFLQTIIQYINSGSKNVSFPSLFIIIGKLMTLVELVVLQVGLFNVRFTTNM